MPDDGMAPVEQLIASARRRLVVKMFTFDQPQLVEAVLAARRRGVSTSVLLNPAKVNGLRLNDATFKSFDEGGVDVRWSNPAFLVTHEKSVVVDDATALIATFNFSEKYFSRTRDYGVLVEDAAAIAEINACFDADRARAPFPTVGAPFADYGPLVWSVLNARRGMADLIDGARKRLLIQHPKFNDPAILDRVLAAVGRGVRVKYLCGGHHGIEEWDLMANLSSQRILAREGARLRRQHHLRCHAKLLVADDEVALLGSMNIDTQAFDRRRELGVVLDERVVVDRLVEQFKRDWRDAKHYKPANPLRPALKERLSVLPDDACGDDPALSHE